MPAHAAEVVAVAPVRRKVSFVAVQRFGDSRRAASILDYARLVAGEVAPRGFDRLPIIQDSGWRGRFVIVSESNLLEPLNAAFSDVDTPCSGAGIAPEDKVDARRNLHVIWLLPRRQPSAAAWGFEPAVAFACEKAVRRVWGVRRVSGTMEDATIKLYQVLARIVSMSQRVIACRIKWHQAPSGIILPFKGNDLAKTDVVAAWRL